mmetsp:Transcript_5258/g.11937  ORF Transcript_5258/g.11937 Transcript_5258/m.11937 type:complete len:375 (-) Transcript_5258:224-1348(-)
MNIQNQTEKLGRGRALTAAALLCFSAAATLYVSSNSPPLQTDPTLIDTDISLSDLSTEETNYYRSLSISQPNGDCQITYAQLSEIDISPTWQASFPGSGARMTWILVRALTGILTNDDNDNHDRGYSKVVAVKTHYPIMKGRIGGLDKMFGRAMVILRNPITAIPSYFNQKYERQNHLPTHSTRGPNEDWIKYRDDPTYGVLAQIAGYEKFVEYWMEKYPERQNLLLFSYEDLTDNNLGPLIATRIANFLGQSEGVEHIATESIPCVWDTIVNYKNAGPPVVEGTLPENNEVNASRKKNMRRLEEKMYADQGWHPSSLSPQRTGPKVRPYTEHNLELMLAMCQRLIEKYSFDEEFVRIMASYIDTVSNTVPSLE